MVDLSRWPSRRLGGAQSGLGGTPLCSLAQLASAAPSGESPVDKHGLQPRTQAPQRWRQPRQRRKQKAARHQSHTQGRQSRQQAGGSAAGSAEPEMKVRLSGPWWPGSLGSGLRVSRHSSVGCSQGPKRGGPDDGRGCPGRGMAHYMVCCSQAPMGRGQEGVRIRGLHTH
uniref:Uncharacterized protein n=1 Tax=Rhinolophus ferrumequinum TaxID=59479 RepID=A0A671DZ18_RHIFE